MDVQSLWNSLENLIINVIDVLAPLKQFEINHSVKNEQVPHFVKQKINKRNRLLKLNNNHNLPLIKSLNKEVKDYFVSRKVGKVKAASIGPKANIWKGVRIAKDLNGSTIPNHLTVGVTRVMPGDFANSFAKYFNLKVINNTEKARVNTNV